MQVQFNDGHSSGYSWLQRIVMVSPPTGGQITIVLVAADIAGVTEVIQVGGAQAVFGLAFGTSTIQSVDKIVGQATAMSQLPSKWCMVWLISINQPARQKSVVVDQPSYTSMLRLKCGHNWNTTLMHQPFALLRMRHWYLIYKTMRLINKQTEPARNFKIQT